MQQLNLFDFKIPSSATPFRYTGGKRKIAHEVLMMMPRDTKEMLSPFLGGGSLEIQAAARGATVYAHDISLFVTEFWKGFLLDPYKTSQEAFDFYFELDQIPDLEFVKARVNELSRHRKVFDLDCPYKVAGIIWAINCMVRDGRPGATFCNNRTEKGANNGEHWGMRKPRFYTDPRFTDWWNPNFNVERLDWRVSMARYPEIFMYADPPYVEKDRLYDNENEKFAHEEFAKMIKERNSTWILSYGEHKMIRDLYSDYKILEPKWTKDLCHQSRRGKVIRQ